MPLGDLDPNAKKDINRGRHAEKQRERRRSAIGGRKVQPNDAACVRQPGT